MKKYKKLPFFVLFPSIDLYPNRAKISLTSLATKEKRLTTQPIKHKTSGSTFKNPTNLFAARLIEEAGCKGMEYGNAVVSNQHANFLINKNLVFVSLTHQFVPQAVHFPYINHFSRYSSLKFDFQAQDFFVK